MKVTREFIMAHRTERGSWTYAQIEALGLECPPRKGWMRTVIGRELTDAQVRQFMDNKVPRKVQAALNRDQPSLF